MRTGRSQGSVVIGACSRWPASRHTFREGIRRRDPIDSQSRAARLSPWKVEYLHVDTGTFTPVAATINGTSGALNLKLADDIVRAGVNYKVLP
jgi:hypothetical protein